MLFAARAGPSAGVTWVRVKGMVGWVGCGVVVLVVSCCLVFLV